MLLAPRDIPLLATLLVFYYLPLGCTTLTTNHAAVEEGASPPVAHPADVATGEIMTVHAHNKAYAVKAMNENCGEGAYEVLSDEHRDDQPASEVGIARDLNAKSGTDNTQVFLRYRCRQQ